ncbi:hypothetical protein JCM3774_000011 [Rhodotorula dairenensis]
MSGSRAKAAEASSTASAPPPPPPPRFHVAPEQAALRAQLVHPDASRGRFGRTTTAASLDDGYAEVGSASLGAGEVRMVKMSGRKDRQTSGTQSPSPVLFEDDVIGDDDDDDDDDAEEDAAGGGGGGKGSKAQQAAAAPPRKARFPNKRNAQSVGRRKIHIEFIEDKPRRHVTFTKRKSGLMKKAYELSTLTGTDCLVVVVSESGLLYTFSTPALSGVTDHPRGREFLEAALRGEIRGDGTGDFDFTAGTGTGTAEASAGGETGGGSRGEKRRRGAGLSSSTTTTAAAAGMAANEEGSPVSPDLGGISVGNGSSDPFPVGGQAYSHHHHHHHHGDGAEFHLDPALHGLDLPVPPMSYSQHQGANAHHHQQQQQQQQLFDLFNFGGSGNHNHHSPAVGGGGGSQPPGSGGEASGNSNPSPHPYSSYPASFFSPQQQQQQSLLPPLANHHHHQQQQLQHASTPALDDLAFATSSSSSHHAAVATSLFDHGSLGFPLGVGVVPAPPPPSSGGPFPSSSSSFVGGPSLTPSVPTTTTVTTDPEAVARAHELATKSYRAALSAAEAYAAASPSSPSASSSTSSSTSFSATSAASPHLGLGGQQLVADSAPDASAAAAPNQGKKARGRKRTVAGTVPVDASDMGWGETLTAAVTTRRTYTIPAFLRAHAYSHYAQRPYPPRFDAAKPLYALADADDAPAMMWASFARMCCRSGVEHKDEMVGAVQEFLARWLPHEMLRNASFHPSFLVPALSHARSGLLSLLDYLEAHLLLSISEADRVSAVLSGGQVRPQAGYDEVPGLGREREQRLYAPSVAAAAAAVAPPSPAPAPAGSSGVAGGTVSAAGGGGAKDLQETQPGTGVGGAEEAEPAAHGHQGHGDELL